MSSEKGQKGFTLIEIVMVLILLGILAAVAVPRFVNFTDDARDAAIDGAFGAINSQLSISIAQYKAIPAVTEFEARVYDIVSSSLTGELNFTAYVISGSGTFDIRSGTSTLGGRGATVSYTSTSKLILAAKADL